LAPGHDLLFLRRQTAKIISRLSKASPDLSESQFKRTRIDRLYAEIATPAHQQLRGKVVGRCDAKSHSVTRKLTPSVSMAERKRLQNSDPLDSFSQIFMGRAIQVSNQKSTSKHYG
jgi:hypothetical protein